MKKYVFRQYDKEYPEFFQTEKKRLRAVLPSGALFEHIGSTSVPGLGGKGFIDILIGIPREKIKSTSR